MPATEMTIAVPEGYEMPHEEDPIELSELARECARRADRARLRAYRIAEALPLSAEDNAEVDRLLCLARGEDDSEGRYLARLAEHLHAVGHEPGARVALGKGLYLIGRPGSPAVYLGAAIPDDGDDVESDREALAERASEYHAATFPG